MKNQFLFEKIFTPTHISLLKGDELKSTTLIQDEFSDLVDVMRKSKYIDLKPINDLMSLFWRLVGNKVCPAAISDSVPSLSFYCEIRANKSMAVIICPEKWHDMLIADAHYQMGAMVFAASQAKDYWNNKFIVEKKEIIEKRAYSFEAELLNFFAKTVVGFKPNDYQKHVIEKYPEGIKSCDLHYIGKDFPC